MSEMKYVYQVKRSYGVEYQLSRWEVDRETPKRYEVRIPDSWHSKGYIIGHLKKSDPNIFIDLDEAGAVYTSKLTERIESARENLNKANKDLAQAPKTIERLRVL